MPANSDGLWGEVRAEPFCGGPWRAWSWRLCLKVAAGSPSALLSPVLSPVSPTVTGSVAVLACGAADTKAQAKQAVKDAAVAYRAPKVPGDVAWEQVDV